MNPRYLIAILLTPLQVAAQDFGVTSSVPAMGDSSVALETTVRFSFSAPLDTTVRFAGPWPVEFFAIDPPGAISIDSVYFSDDLTEIDFNVTQKDSTDFTWLLSGAYNSDSALACPFVLNYSTSEVPGRFSVEGSAGAWYLVKSATCFGMVVGLRNAPYYKPGHLVAAAISNPDLGTYSIDHVRPGTYWPVAYFDQNANGIIEPNWSIAPTPDGEATHLGLFGESAIDSVVVSDHSLTGVDMVFIGGATESDSPSSPVTGLSAYPNPFPTSFSLAFEVINPGKVRISLYDILGRRVSAISDGFLNPGLHEIAVNLPPALPSGAYVIFVATGSGSRSLLMLHSN